MFLVTVLFASTGTAFAKWEKAHCDSERLKHPEGEDLGKDIEWDFNCSWMKGTTGGVPTGSLTLPEEHADKYDVGIVAVDDDGKVLSLVDLIVRITNWALGFVGLVAMVAFVFGGYLMVANFGNDDMTSKGKKVIMGSSIGIIVILISFTAVNALLGAAGGRPIGAVTDEVEGVSKDYLEATLAELENTLFDIFSNVEDVGDLCPGTPKGKKVSLVGCASGEYPADSDGDGVINKFDGDDDNDGVLDLQDDDDDGDGISDENDFCPDTLLFSVARPYAYPPYKGLIERGVLTKENVKIGVVEQGDAPLIIPYVRPLSSVTGYPGAEGDLRGVGCAAYEGSQDTDGDGYPNGLVGGPEEIACDDGDEESGGFDCDDDNDGELDKTDPDNDGDGVPDGPSVSEITAGVTAPPEEFLLPELIAKSEREIYLTCSRLPQTFEVRRLCLDPNGTLITAFNSFRTNPTEEAMRGLFEQLVILRDIVKITPKVIAKMSVIPGGKGSAPFSVFFDGAESVDPFGVQRSDEHYEWCIGYTTIQESLECPPGKRETGSYISHTFDEPGSYAVQLRVSTPEAEPLSNRVNTSETELVSERQPVKGAMDGYSAITIIVNPSSANIVMKVSAGVGESENVTDKRKHEVLLNVASTDGVLFDASSTTDYSKTGTTNILTTKWDFGDGVIEELDGFIAQRKHVYSEPGSYNVVFEIKDNRFSLSRKVLELVVTDIVASLDILPESRKGDVATQFTFDASNSSVEGGEIGTYLWEIIDDTNNSLVIDSTLEGNRNLTGPVVNYSFPDVGQYRVKVTVEALGNRRHSTEEEVQILSRSPVARFMWRISDKQKPATVFLDAGGSTDPDPNTELKYTWKIDGESAELVGNDKVPMMGNHTFDSAGEHRVELVVTDGTDVTDSIIHIVKIDSTLDVDFTADKFSAYPDTTITFTGESETAAGYFWDFGDGVKKYSDVLNIGHEYGKAGNYNVTLTVDNLQGEENTISKRVRIGDKDSPIAAVRVLLDGLEVEPDERICGNGEGILVDRLSALSLDGSNSVNTDGTSRGLKYSWDFDDGQRATSRSTVHKFEEITVGSDCYKVKLAVSDRVTGKSNISVPVYIRVENTKPTAVALDVVAPPKLVTPISVPINLVGSKDTDGRIVDYTWWYYDKQVPNKKIDVHVTTDSKTIFTVGPRAKEGIESTYYFAVEMRDNDGGKISSEDAIGQSQALKVTNGPSLAPVVEYTVDKVRAKVGEKISFTSVSKDPLGRYISTSNYKWDFYGDGRYDREIVGPEVEFTYDRPGTYLPRLKVISEGISETYEMEIIVEAVTENPESAFLFIKSGNKIIFINNSTVDSQLDVASLRYAWDFDTEVDTDGNGIEDDDIDSAQVNPSHVYDLVVERDVEVKLVVTDEMGQSDEVVRKVISTKKEEFGALGATVVKKLRAVLDADPMPDELDKKVYLKQTEGELTFVMKKSTGKIKEYHLDLNIYKDSDEDGVADNDIDNSLHESLDNGALFTHKYEEDAGKIRAQLTIEDFQGKTDSTYIDIILNESGMSPFESTFDPDSIFLISGMAPIALFTVQDEVVVPQKEATFDASGSSFPEESIKEYRWDFDGDGEVDETSNQPLVEYAYTEEGQYEITLGIFSESDLYTEYSETIFVRDLYNDPVSDFSYEIEDLTVRFENLSTYDKSFKGNKLNFEWKFIPLLDEEEETSNVEEVEVVEELILTDESSEDSVLVISKLETYQGLVNRPVTLEIAGLSVEFNADTSILDANDKPYTKTISVPKVISAPKGSLDLERKVIDAFMIASVKPLFVSQNIKFELDLVSYEGLSDPEIAIFDLADKTWKVLESSEQDGKLIVDHDHLGIYALTDNREAEVIKSTTKAEESFKKTLKISEASTSEEPVKIFDNYGTYKIVLTVADKAGRKDSKIHLITLEPGVSTAFEPETPTVTEEEILEPEVVEEESLDSTEDLQEELISEENVPEEVITTTEITTPVTEKKGGIGWFMIVMGIVLFIALIVGVIFIFNKIKEQLANHEGVMTGGVPGMPPVSEGGTPTPPVEVLEGSGAEGAEGVERAKGKKEEKVEVQKKETKSESKKTEPKKEPAVQPEKKKGGENDDKSDKDAGPAPEGGEGAIPDWLKK